MGALTYGEFGRAFVHQAVTPERVLAVLAAITGDRITVGPIAAGPGGAARATCVGTLGAPQLTKTAEEPLTYAVALPAKVSLDVDLAGVSHRYDGEVEVRFSIAVQTEEPLSVVVHPTHVSARDVKVKVGAKGLRAKALATIGDLDGELRREVAAYVNARMEGPDAAQATRIDLLPLIESTWSSAVL